MLILTKYKDSTYSWTKIPYIFGPYSKAYTIAYTKWFLKMNRYQIDTGMKFLNDMDYDIVTYKNLQFDSVRKVNYTEIGKI